MALDFNILNLKKNENSDGYHMEIKVNGFIGEYIIFTDAKMIYNDWLPKDLQFSVLDGFDCPFNGVPPYLMIKGMNLASRKKEKEVESVLIKFIRGECSNGAGQ